MGQTVPTQNPAVVLRSHFNRLRALLAVALIVLLGLTVAVVILANDEDQISDTSSAAPIGHLNYGGFNPATGRPESAPLAQQEHPLRSRVGTAQSDAPITGSSYDGAAGEGPHGPKDYAKNAATGDVPSPSSAGPKDYSENAATGDVSSPSIGHDGGSEEGTRGVR
jgi:hypothetical protein